MEGIGEDVDEFVRRIKVLVSALLLRLSSHLQSLNWQALQVRHTLSTSVPAPDVSPASVQRRHVLLNSTKLAGVLMRDRIGAVEVGTLSEVGELLRGAGMADGFSSILKC